MTVFVVALFMNSIGLRLRSQLAGRLGGFYSSFVVCEQGKVQTDNENT